MTRYTTLTIAVPRKAIISIRGHLSKTTNGNVSLSSIAATVLRDILVDPIKIRDILGKPLAYRKEAGIPLGNFPVRIREDDLQKLQGMARRMHVRQSHLARYIMCDAIYRFVEKDGKLPVSIRSKVLETIPLHIMVAPTKLHTWNHDLVRLKVVELVALLKKPTTSPEQRAKATHKMKEKAPNLVVDTLKADNMLLEALTYLNVETGLTAEQVLSVFHARYGKTIEDIEDYMLSLNDNEANDNTTTL